MNSNVQNGQNPGGPSDYLEEIAVLNQDFLISIQNALRNSPKDCLAPLAMDYLQFLYTIMKNSKGTKLEGLQSSNEPVDFTTVAIFFQALSEQISKYSTEKPTNTTASFGTKSVQKSGLGSTFNTGTTNNSFQNAGPNNLSTSTFSQSSFSTTTLSNTAPQSTAPTSSTFRFNTSGIQNSGLSMTTNHSVSLSSSSTTATSPLFTPLHSSTLLGAPALPTSTRGGGFTTQNPTTTTITFGSPALNSSSVTTKTVPPPTFGSFTTPTSSAFGFSMPAPPQNTSLLKGDSTVNRNTNETTEKDNDSEDDTPPKPDFVPVVETDALYTKRIKLFAMVDKTYADRGVGNLFVKKLNGGSEKCQLVIRADNSLGKILLNVVLNSSIVLELKPPNNILASVPGKDDKPITYVIRVKTAAEANELLKTLEKHKLGA